MTDARNLTDRELLILTHSKVMEIEDLLIGPDGVKRRLAVLETKVEERTAPKTITYGIPAGVAGLLVVIWEAAKRWMEGS